MSIYDWNQEQFWFLVDSILQYKTHLVFSWTSPTKFNHSRFEVAWPVADFFGILDTVNQNVPGLYYAMRFFYQ